MSHSIRAIGTARPSTEVAPHGAPVVIFATFVPKPGNAEQVRRALDTLVQQTRKEPGCLRFDLYDGLESLKTFRLFEVFESQQAVDAHRDTDHYRTYRATVIPLLQAAPVVVLMAPINAAFHTESG